MGLRSSLWLAAALSASVLASAAFAGNAVKRPLAVVELFTSQGCNSCPPADALLGELAESRDVVALAYHVDYWDYLGWRDTLATPENTERQNAYGHAFGMRSVYTPQLVVNGRRHMNGSKADAVRSAMLHLEEAGEAMSVDVQVSYTGDSIVIETGAAEGPAAKAHLLLAFFEPRHSVRIASGKNEGSTFVYRNSVSAMQSAGMWHGRAARFELPMSEFTRKNAGGCAVLLQRVEAEGLPGPIIGAALVHMPES